MGAKVSSFEGAEVFLGVTRAAYVGPALDPGPHANAVAVLAIALTNPFRLSLAAESAGRMATVALIGPRIRHHLQAGGPMAFLYLDALDDDVAALERIDLAAARSRLLAYLNTSSTRSIADMFAAIGVPRSVGSDRRVAEVVGAMTDDPDRFTSVADAAAHVGLSASRFQRLFKASVGVPFRRFRLWRRMAVAMTAVSEGRSLTEAAHQAGFAGSAHFSSAFRDMFGLAPTDLLSTSVRFHVETGDRQAVARPH